MVNRPVTIGTINDYMHERNGQKQDHPQRADPGGPKARGVVIWKQCGAAECKLTVRAIVGQEVVMRMMMMV